MSTPVLAASKVAFHDIEQTTEDSWFRTIFSLEGLVVFLSLFGYYRGLISNYQVQVVVSIAVSVMVCVLSIYRASKVRRVQIGSPALSMLLLFFLIGISVFTSPLVDGQSEKYLKFFGIIIPCAFGGLVIGESGAQALLRLTQNIFIQNVGVAILTICAQLGFNIAHYRIYGSSMVDLDELTRDDFRGVDYIGINTALGLLLLTNFYRASNRSVYLKRAIKLTIGIVALYLMLQTGGRGPALALVASLLITEAVICRRSLMIVLGIPLISVVLVAATATTLRTFIEDSNELKTLQRILAVFDDDSGTHYTRIYYLTKSLDAYVESPVLGAGFGGWAEVVQIVGEAYPHNISLEILVELGAIGAILSLTMFVSTIKNCKDASLPQVVKVSIFSVLVFELVMHHLSSSFTDARVLFMIIGVSGGIATVKKIHPATT